MPSTTPPTPPTNVWVVVAAYQESKRLPGTLSKLRHAGKYQIVVVDDGSGDGTAAVAAAAGGPVWVLRHPINCGQGAAIQTGIQFALDRGADAIVTFDGDGQHDAREINDVLLPIDRGTADVVLGSRFFGATIAMPLTRRVLLKLAICYTRLTTRLAVTDTHNGFRAFSRHAAGQIRIRQPRMAHASEILEEIVRHQLRWTEVPVTIRYTGETLAKGQSGWDALRIAGQLALGRFVR